MQVLVYSSATQKQVRQFTRFKDIAYSGSFREDGKLLVAGGQDSLVQVILRDLLLRASCSRIHF